uniref:Plasmid replication protein origin binding domain-containing protein n=1 Tax=uncultured prokaryote TaxID=198431 RepID=A0A0H5Q4A1_9ZZZZ|nr:hypothetical protein [uncultured prokaryote]
MRENNCQSGQTKKVVHSLLFIRKVGNYFMAEKARYWNGVLYPENMVDDWEDVISDKLQVPYAYCIHDKDLNEDGTKRKTHIHITIVFPNTTTYNHAFDVLNTLSKKDKKALNKIERAINIRYSYNYLIHDTDTCRKKNKYLYDRAERITGNNFDIGSYEQISVTDKNRMTKELCNVIVENGYTNFADFYMYVISNFDEEYFEILRTYSGLFERLTRGMFLKYNNAEREQ